jgi:DNA-directed RNA polymerase subunit F|tara:strand:+ start:917 stop:1246 length:330 start_codon:yes stop_codon:yes gene_type:complete
MEIIEKKPTSIPEMKENIDFIKKRDKELNFRAKKVEEYINNVPKTKTYKELKQDLESAGITRLRDKHITLIINILPTDIDSLRIILSSENLTLKQEDLEKILTIVKKHA